MVSEVMRLCSLIVTYLIVSILQIYGIPTLINVLSVNYGIVQGLLEILSCFWCTIKKIRKFEITEIHLICRRYECKSFGIWFERFNHYFKQRAYAYRKIVHWQYSSFELNIYKFPQVWKKSCLTNPLSNG